MTMTPERIRDAAEVVIAYQSPPHVWTPQEAEAMSRAAKVLAHIAEKAERRLAEEKRERRVEELAGELLNIHLGTGISGKWNDFARALLDRYPVLAEPAACGKGPCCLHDGHDGRCEL